MIKSGGQTLWNAAEGRIRRLEIDAQMTLNAITSSHRRWHQRSMCCALFNQPRDVLRVLLKFSERIAHRSKGKRAACSESVIPVPKGAATPTHFMLAPRSRDSTEKGARADNLVVKVKEKLAV